MCLVWLPVAFSGGGPDPDQAMKQMWVQDVAQVATEQGIHRGDLIKQLVLDLLDEIGYVKALLWLAMLPLAAIVGVVFGALKIFQRKG